MGSFECTDSKVALNISQKQNYSDHEVPVTQFCKNFQVTSSNRNFWTTRDFGPQKLLITIGAVALYGSEVIHHACVEDSAPSCYW